MKELYRIKKGLLQGGDFNIPFDFGLVFFDKGFYKMDFYISESYPLYQYPPYSRESRSEVEQQDMALLFQIFRMTALTDDNNLIASSDLHVNSFERHLFKISMTSYGRVVHRLVRREEEAPVDIENFNGANLYYIELEGFKIDFSDFTEVQRERGGIEIDRHSRYKHDHTSAVLIYNHTDYNTSNSFPVIFSKKLDSDNIVISFSPANERQGSPIPYNIFTTIRRDFVSLLSFANGSETRIISEHIGEYYRISEIYSQITILYSGTPVDNKNYSGFFSLGKSVARSERILNNLLFNCFNNYVEQNKIYDLNRLIFHINGANRADNLQERFYILIIALERLAKKHVDSIDSKDFLFIDKNKYDPIKQELYQILDKHSDILGDKINSFKGRIGELNITKSKSTEFKFVKLLEFVNIPITPEIQKIIYEVRHEAVHYGETGDNRESVINYHELDELLRLIIIRLIGYKGAYLPYKNRYTRLGR